MDVTSIILAVVGIAFIAVFLTCMVLSASALLRIAASLEAMQKASGAVEEEEKGSVSSL